MGHRLSKIYTRTGDKGTTGLAIFATQHFFSSDVKSMIRPSIQF